MCSCGMYVLSYGKKEETHFYEIQEILLIGLKKKQKQEQKKKKRKKKIKIKLKK